MSNTTVTNPRELEVARSLWQFNIDTRVIVEVMQEGQKTRRIEGTAIGVGDYFATHLIDHDRTRILVSSRD